MAMKTNGRMRTTNIRTSVFSYWMPRDYMAFSLLFTGHMLDKPGRPRPRFPADHEGRVREKISSAISCFVTDCVAQQPDAQIIGFASAARGVAMVMVAAGAGSCIVPASVRRLGRSDL